MHISLSRDVLFIWAQNRNWAHILVLSKHERGMMMQIKKTVEPLLYIAQPALEQVVASMQEDYRGESGGNITVVKTEKREINNKPSDSAFKNLTVLEKINYLTGLPREIPTIRCEVKTEKNTYRGTIKQHSETEINVHVLGRGNEVIQISSIKGINLIGF